MLTPVLLTNLGLVIWLYWSAKHASASARRRMTVGLAIYMFVQPFTEPLAAVLFGIYPPEMASLIPVHLCDYSAIILGFVLLQRRQFWFDFAFYAGISAGLQATIFYLSNPVTWANPFFVENYLSHWLLMAIPVFLVLTTPLRPTHSGMYKALAMMVVLAVPAAIVNQILGTNIMYLCDKPQGASIMNSLPEWPVYLPVLLGIALGEFYGHFGIYRSFATLRSRFSVGRDVE